MKQLNCTDCTFVAKNAAGLNSHTRRHKKSMDVAPINNAASGGVCHNCHALPIGSVELVSLLLVLVFSLTAVLLTSAYALDSQQQEITSLKAQLN